MDMSHEHLTARKRMRGGASIAYYKRVQQEARAESGRKLISEHHYGRSISEIINTVSADVSK